MISREGYDVKYAWHNAPMVLATANSSAGEHSDSTEQRIETSCRPFLWCSDRRARSKLRWCIAPKPAFVVIPEWNARLSTVDIDFLNNIMAVWSAKLRDNGVIDYTVLGSGIAPTV